MSRGDRAEPVIAENGDHLTREEDLAIKALRRLAKRWPRSLTLISMGGVLHVMHTGDPRFDGATPTERGAVVLDSFAGIPHDGGDW